MKTLYVMGCSFATPNFCVDPKDSFWGLAAKDLNVDKIVNFSHSGFSLDILVHILCNEEIDFEDNYMLFCVPPLPRINTFTDNPKPIIHHFKEYDKDFNCTEKVEKSLTNVEWLSYYELVGDSATFIGRLDHQWVEVESLNKLYMVHNFLTSKKINFIIPNLTRPILYQENWPTGEVIMKKMADLPECILFKDTPYDVNERDNINPVDRDPTDPDRWYGHHGPVGNLNWYTKVLKNKMKELNWIS